MPSSAWCISQPAPRPSGVSGRLKSSANDEPGPSGGGGTDTGGGGVYRDSYDGSSGAHAATATKTRAAAAILILLMRAKSRHSSAYVGDIAAERRWCQILLAKHIRVRLANTPIARPTGARRAVPRLVSPDRSVQPPSTISLHPRPNAAVQAEVDGRGGQSTDNSIRKAPIPATCDMPAVAAQLFAHGKESRQRVPPLSCQVAGKIARRGRPLPALAMTAGCSQACAARTYRPRG